MEVYERVRLLRKKYLNLSQEQLGSKLGVSRSVIRNIENNALSRPDLKKSLLKQLCAEFDVNEDWLFNGTGMVFIRHNKPVPDINVLINELDLSMPEVDFFSRYLQLDKERRLKLIEQFQSLTDFKS